MLQPFPPPLTVEKFDLHAALPELPGAGGLFVFRSLFEGLAGAVIEATALGLPVVAPDIPPMREVLEPDENALQVEPGGAAAIADADVALLAEPAQVRRFAERSRHRFLSKFTLERVVDRMVQLHEDVVGARG